MNRFKSTQRVATLGIGANIVLLIGKLVIGYICNSQAMIADGFNSAGDVFASLMTFIGNKISSKPEDKNHPFGHGKAEYIFSMIISLSLLLVAFKIFRDSFNSIMDPSDFTFSWWLVGVAIFTIITKGFLFKYTLLIGKETENLLVRANSEDHRNDIFVTAGTLLGIALSRFGIYWADGVVGIGIALWIAFTGIKIFSSAYYILMDTNIDKVFESDISKLVANVKGVDHIDSIAAKPIGLNYIVIVKASVDGRLSIAQGHSISAEIRAVLKQQKKISDVIVHINPC